MAKDAYNLLCVTGLTPQIVTETVYALGAPKSATDTAALPNTIHIITTLRGKQLIEQTLLGRNGHLARLCREYGWNASSIAFDADHVHVIVDADGKPLDDIRDAADNAAAANFITTFIRNAANKARRLHVSLAGGRKTMGYFTGYALSLYGRPADRLSHVLVNAPFESQHDFFYPPPQPQWLEIGGQHVSTADAVIELADIPFIRLRDGLDQNLLADNLSFSESVARTQQLLDPPELRIDLSSHEVWLQDHPLKLPNTQFLWLTWMASRAHNELEPLPFDVRAATDLLRIVDMLEGSGASKLREAVTEAQADADRGDIGYFERTRSRLNNSIVERTDLYPAAAKRYRIKSFGRKPNTCYGLEPDTFTSRAKHDLESFPKPVSSIAVARLRHMKKITYIIRFLTPAFLGDANQNGAWRVPPFKAELRQWWRIVLARRNPTMNWSEIRDIEAELFGNAWRGKEPRKSCVRMRLSKWDAGKLNRAPSVRKIENGKANVDGGPTRSRRRACAAGAIRIACPTACGSRLLRTATSAAG